MTYSSKPFSLLESEHPHTSANGLVQVNTMDKTNKVRFLTCLFPSKQIFLGNTPLAFILPEPKLFVAFFCQDIMTHKYQYTYTLVS